MVVHFKDVSNNVHFYSSHGWIGLATYILLLVQVSAFVAFFFSSPYCVLQYLFGVATLGLEFFGVILSNRALVVRLHIGLGKVGKAGGKSPTS